MTSFSLVSLFLFTYQKENSTYTTLPTQLPYVGVMSCGHGKERENHDTTRQHWKVSSWSPSSPMPILNSWPTMVSEVELVKSTESTSSRKIWSKSKVNSLSIATICNVVQDSVFLFGLIYTDDIWVHFCSWAVSPSLRCSRAVPSQVTIHRTLKLSKK